MSFRLVNERGQDPEVRGREPREVHWGHYRKAAKKRPDLVRAMYGTIEAAVCEFVAHSEPGHVINSSRLGAAIMEDWEHREDWDRYCASPNVSSPLFGQIMWTYIFDRASRNPGESWCTTLTDTSKAGREREERAYFLEVPKS